MTIVTFMNFEYSNHRYDSSVTLVLNKDSMVFDSPLEAVRWLTDHNFELPHPNNQNIWERKVTRESSDYGNGIPYTDERAIITSAEPRHNDEDWTIFCHEGHWE